MATTGTLPGNIRTKPPSSCFLRVIPANYTPSGDKSPVILICYSIGRCDPMVSGSGGTVVLVYIAEVSG